MAKRTKEQLEALPEDEILYELLWKRHNAIDITKIISSETTPNGQFIVRIGGEKMKEAEIQNLRSEAQMIQGTRLWKLMIETSSAAAEDSIFKSSKNIEDIHYGKAVLFSISIFKNILSTIQRPNLNKDPNEAQRATTQRFS